MEKRLKGQARKESSPFDRVKKSIWEDPSFSAKFFPYLKEETAWIIHRPSDQSEIEIGDDGLPVPPQRLWYGFWENSKQYLASGKNHFKAMMNILDASGFLFGEKDRILDFGCGAGRIIRCFKDLKFWSEIWGVDIDAERILWCQEHLSPPLRFITTTTFPHLPFEDNYFNIIYAGSVFTHISDLAEAWLMELRRILRPNGRCYITIRDNHSIELILSCPPDHWLYNTPMRHQLLAFEKEKHFSASGFSIFVTSRDPGHTEVFYDIDFLRKNWECFFKIISINPEAYGYQTAVTLGK
jgi:ubiquinone/menaquinone biosynthesis C-methylase UbiE